MSFTNMDRNFPFRGRAGVTEGPEDNDYENMASSKEDLPPKPGTRKFAGPGSIAPPRPPRAGKKTVKPSLPSKSPQAAGLGSSIVPCPPLPQMGLHLNSSACQTPQMAAPILQPIQGFQLSQVPQSSQNLQPSHIFQPSQGLQLTQVPQLSQGLELIQVPESSQKRKIPQLTRKEKMAVCLYMLVGITLLLGVTNFVVTTMKLTGPRDLIGLKMYIDQIRDDTNRTITELQDLIGCNRKSCPKEWLPFGGSCYFFSTVTSTWDAARKFCMENYSHLVIISSSEEQDFVTKARNPLLNYWLGLTDRKVEGLWKWLDESWLTLSFWNLGEPNNNYNEDCAIMVSDSRWNDVSCFLKMYWICERKCTY